MIRIPAVTVLLATSFLTVRAGSIDTSAKKTNAATVADRTDSSSASSKKICTCQLMSVKTEKFDSHLVGIFAEKTLEGKKKLNYRVMNEFIRREKIYFRVVFLRALEVQEKFKSATDCQSLYNKLKSENYQLVMYNILNVDALTSLVKK